MLLQRSSASRVKRRGPRIDRRVVAGFLFLEQISMS